MFSFNKLIKWPKKHPLISIVIAIILLWAVNKVWHMIFGMLQRPEATHVETVIVAPQPSQKRWQAVGTVKAAQDIQVASQISGIVQEIVVANNQMVKQGQVLINIRHDDIAANLERDQAELTQKQLYYQRVQRLAKSNTISQEALSEAQSNYAQAQANVVADQALIDKYSIKAPFDGQLGIWQVDIGQLVKPGDALVTLTALSPAYIDFMLPPKVLSNISVGDQIQFTTESYPNRTWQGKVIAIDPQLDAETRNVKLRAQVDNADGKLVPRLFGQVNVIQPIAPQIIIPQEAIIYDPAGTSVYTLVNNTIQQTPVSLGEHIDNNVVITKGLKAGDVVVTAGMMKVFPGMSVIVNKQVKQLSVPAAAK